MRRVNGALTTATTWHGTIESYWAQSPGFGDASMPAIRQVMTSGFATLAMGSSRVYIRVSPLFLDTSVQKITEQTVANAKMTSSIFAWGAHSQVKGARTENILSWDVGAYTLSRIETTETLVRSGEQSPRREARGAQLVTSEERDRMALCILRQRAWI